MTTNATLLAAALTAAEHGWPVFPLRPGTKKPALHGDTDQRPCPRTGICRHGHRTWEQRAMLDPDEIRWYWTSPRYTGCNIGIATGPSGLVVIDLDTPKSPTETPPERWSRSGCRDGHDVFAWLCQDAGQPAPWWDTYQVATARHGTHLYYQAPTGTDAPRLRNTEGEQGNGLGWKVDTRAWGGYVVAPDSITPDGIYRLAADVPTLDLPGWLVHRLAPRPPTASTAPRQIATTGLAAYVAAAVQSECARIATAPPGHGRALFISALALGQLVGAHVLPPATAENALYTAAHPMINAGCGCTEREIRRAITNGLRVGAQRPRQVPTERPAA